MANPANNHKETGNFENLYIHINDFIAIASYPRYKITSEKAEDIFQDTLEVYLLKLISGEIEKPSETAQELALLKKIYKDKIIDFKRHGIVHNNMLEHEKIAIPAAAIAEAKDRLNDEHTKILIAKLLGILKPKARKAMELKYFEDLSSNEIAEKMNLKNDDAVNHVVFAAMKKIKKYALNKLMMKLWLLLSFIGLSGPVNDFAEFFGSIDFGGA